MKVFKFFMYNLTGLSLVVLILFFVHTENNRPERIRSTSSPKSSIEMKKGRAEYFFNLMRDPATNQIPADIRQKELKFARELQKRTSSIQKTSSTLGDLVWKEAGPNDVGGRTRALAIDKTNSSVIIAGGVSGGIWKSINNGTSWTMKSTTNQVLSVTSLAQDPRTGNTNNWYYTTGEFSGNSAADRSQKADFTGGGIYKSTNSGETWALLPATKDSDPTLFNTMYDYISKIVVSPTTGTVFAASSPFGIIRSTDGGASFTLVIGQPNDHVFNDVGVTADGTVIATLSSGFNANPQNQPGVYKSSNDGVNWTSITPGTIPAYHERSVLALTPSNNDIVYVLTFTGQLIDQKYDDVRFHKITISTGVSEDRTINMPNFGNDFEDFLHTQQNYNMVVAVKPDDENFVVIGATSLFRSTNGFTTKPADVVKDWIGGYNLQTFNYPNFHSDVHSFAFDPTNPNAMWWGHDGGLSYTADIRNTSFSDFFPWENKNNSYNVTQFYMITIDDAAGDDRILGGTQDNGSPSFRFNGTSTTASEDISTGDGAYAYLGNSFAYTSAQNGAVLRVDYDGSNNPSRNNGWSYISPKDATSQLFINPFVIDPVDENILIYPAGNVLWRNNQLNSLPYNSTFASGITEGWTKLDNLSVPSGYIISTMVMSISNPTHRLYYGATNSSDVPKVYRLDNAHSATGAATEFTISGAASGSYLHHIAINPDNGAEILAILSNYNIVGIYHSSNGGQTFTAVEGNLEGTTGNPGPSIRAATILPGSQATRYLVATSTGVYSTTTLNGAATTWIGEGETVIGNVVVNYLASRKSDGRVAAGTHGRGIFVSDGTQSGNPIASVDTELLTLQAKPGETGTTTFTLENTGDANLNYNISVSGSFSNVLPKISEPEYVLRKTGHKTNIKHKPLNLATSGFVSSKSPKSIISSKDHNSESTLGVQGTDVLFLDDGDATPDGFLGWGDGSNFAWLNEFNLGGSAFQREKFDFYMKSDLAASNNVFVAVYDQNENILVSGFLTLAGSENGAWFTITLDQSIAFEAGATFYISVETNSSFIAFPAGADTDASITNKSFYYDGFNLVWINLNTLSGYENGAFLIRATGTLGGGANVDPVAVVQLSKTQADVDELITFDASQSSDTDGQITAYLWDFGDGSTSEQSVINHSYSQANTYNYTLTVTDDKSATNQTAGQVTISETSVQHVTADPSSGTIVSAGSQTITLTLDATGLELGNYSGQVDITSNGGNITIPIGIVVDIEDVKQLPTDFSLSQNYPNPFNPSTTIDYQIGAKDHSPVQVKLIVYNVLGEKVATLVSGRLPAGNYKVVWDATGFASGVYLYKLETDEGFVQTKKLVILK